MIDYRKLIKEKISEVDDEETLKEILLLLLSIDKRVDQIDD